MEKELYIVSYRYIGDKFCTLAAVLAIDEAEAKALARSYIKKEGQKIVKGSLGADLLTELFAYGVMSSKAIIHEDVDLNDIVELKINKPRYT